MEDLILTPREHKVLKKFQKNLQRRFNVKIQMPNIVTSTDSDVIFVSIDGETQNRELVKKFLAEKSRMTTEKAECKENIILITLSDSEEELVQNLSAESDAESEEKSALVVNDLSYSESSTKFIDELNMVSPLENSICIIESPVLAESSSKYPRSIVNDGTVHSKKKNRNQLDNSVCIIESPVTLDSSSRLCRSSRNVEKGRKEKKRYGNITKSRRKRSKGTLPSYEPFEEAELCEVSSTTDEKGPKKVKLSEDSGLLTKELSEFIPLHSTKRSHLEDVKPCEGSRDSFSREKSDDVILLDEPSSVVRPLRPVVIDGSNVAREHGKVSNTFSAKGIKLAVDYFLNRGHTQVTAFVPKFRRFCNRKNFPTTDPEILDELANKQHVVFTPSRRLNGQCIASYDDRFIVQLASTNGGVIVSNDNYRDLITENDSFKEVIEKRLLMFCFVGDIFMIPSDPLGRNGPSLSEFLSFPPDAAT